MAVDLGPLLTIVAELADELERDYGPEVELSVALVAVELIENGDENIIEHRTTEPSTAHALGLVELTAASLRAGYRRDDRDG